MARCRPIPRVRILWRRIETNVEVGQLTHGPADRASFIYCSTHAGSSPQKRSRAWWSRAPATAGPSPRTGIRRSSGPGHPRPAKPDGPKVVNRRPGRDQLVPQPAAEAQPELRLHPRSQVPQPGHGRQKCFDPAVKVSCVQVQNLQRAIPPPTSAYRSLSRLCSTVRSGFSRLLVVHPSMISDRISRRDIATSQPG